MSELVRNSTSLSTSSCSKSSAMGSGGSGLALRSLDSAEGKNTVPLFTGVCGGISCETQLVFIQSLSKPGMMHSSGLGPAPSLLGLSGARLVCRGKNWLPVSTVLWPFTRQELEMCPMGSGGEIKKIRKNCQNLCSSNIQFPLSSLHRKTPGGPRQKETSLFSPCPVSKSSQLDPTRKTTSRARRQPSPSIIRP